MSDALTHLLGAIRQMMQSADIDHALLSRQKIGVDWFADYDQQRIINSFLFNYIKIQDKIGGKLFRLVLQHWREDDTDAMTMLDVLNRLERLRIINSVEEWDTLREVRNAVTHEYPEETQTRIDNINLALSGYVHLKREHYAFVPSPKNRLSQRFLRGHLASSWSECLLFKPIPYLLAL